MLFIRDLNADCTLDSAAMSGVRGGMYMLAVPASYYGFGYFNSPSLDVGTQEALQSQTVLVDQTEGAGGFNAVSATQSQNGVSGQVAI